MIHNHKQASKEGTQPASEVTRVDTPPSPQLAGYPSRPGETDRSLRTPRNIILAESPSPPPSTSSIVRAGPLSCRWLREPATESESHPRRQAKTAGHAMPATIKPQALLQLVRAASADQTTPSCCGQQGRTRFHSPHTDYSLLSSFRKPPPQHNSPGPPVPRRDQASSGWDRRCPAMRPAAAPCSGSTSPPAWGSSCSPASCRASPWGSCRSASSTSRCSPRPARPRTSLTPVIVPSPPLPHHRLARAGGVAGAPVTASDSVLFLICVSSLPLTRAQPGSSPS
jgi:hypothetical protein